ncbi:MAG: prepilin-type N-terminal cleavage/methylation domain-containing protein [Acidobacteria bacterium]|nr:prepilin-type N-terminal cleavage/methylation domain-containing protein [Acidobacteriota bacterium]MBU4494720.1 prepilin-type N-terminal cleavage/methylation domain-containing protein [Acidobacteriota bacterium]
MIGQTQKKSRRGFSAIEVLVVLAILGLLTALSFPSVVNSLETRNLESTAKDILNEMQRAKFQAVKTKLNHRLRFAQDSGRWIYVVEREDAVGTWNPVQGIVVKTISPGFSTTVDLPSLQVVFSPLGMVTNFSSAQNSVVVHSSKLAGYNQPADRYVYVFSGGSVHYSETSLVGGV